MGKSLNPIKSFSTSTVFLFNC